MSSTQQAALHEVRELIEQRSAAVSAPGARTDGYRLALAIEGGGMRGTISAGMALALHELGLSDAFDDVYGSSAGAIVGAWLLSSYPGGLRVWTDAVMAKALIRPFNLLIGRPAILLTRLIEQIYVEVLPMEFGSVLASPIPLHVIATSVDTGDPVDLYEFVQNPPDLRRALRASAALPVIAGAAVEIAGRRYFDAGIAESIPYKTALSQGATHVLILSSRRAAEVVRSDWSRASRLVAATVLRKYPDAFKAVYLTRNARLAEDDAVLAPGGKDRRILAIRPAADSIEVGGMERDAKVLHAALEAGRTAVYTAFGFTAPEPGPSKQPPVEYVGPLRARGAAAR